MRHPRRSSRRLRPTSRPAMIEHRPGVAHVHALALNVDEVPVLERRARHDVVGPPVGVEMHGSLVPPPRLDSRLSSTATGCCPRFATRIAAGLPIRHDPAAGHRAVLGDRPLPRLEGMERIRAAEEVADRAPDRCPRRRMSSSAPSSAETASPAADLSRMVNCRTARWTVGQRRFRHGRPADVFVEDCSRSGFAIGGVRQSVLPASLTCAAAS